MSVSLFHNDFCVFIVTGSLAYLLGSIPFGPILTKLAGLGDLRHIGSGNTGATNVLRTGHKSLAAATLVLDAAKGSVAVLLIPIIFPHLSLQTAVIAAFFAVFGHCYPVFLEFHGGKGVATGLGTILALSPITGILGCVLWLCAARFTHISSVGALSAFTLMPIIACINFFIKDGLSFHQAFIPITTFLISSLVIARHRGNVTRLLSGKEPKIGMSKQNL
ncbi:MAG: glycerol-3-phosphate 1-O-acyltransferase PlsY [Acetobacter sp.]|nr:glycerol-3-phosphate 1-O-acyltransferase PlsY [Acetobacter sp.]